MRSAAYVGGLLLLIAPIARADWTPSPSSAEEAAVFIQTLAARAPEFDGAPLRIYEIRDVDFDGRFEVLEHASAIEERATGYLDGRWTAPTYWVTVYSDKGGRFEDATAKFRSFLQTRIAFYEGWVRLIEVSPNAPVGVEAEVRKNLERARRLLAPDSA